MDMNKGSSLFSDSESHVDSVRLPMPLTVAQWGPGEATGNVPLVLESQAHNGYVNILPFSSQAICWLSFILSPIPLLLPSYLTTGYTALTSIKAAIPRLRVDSVRAGSGADTRILVHLWLAAASRRQTVAQLPGIGWVLSQIRPTLCKHCLSPHGCPQEGYSVSLEIDSQFCFCCFQACCGVGSCVGPPIQTFPIANGCKRLGSGCNDVIGCASSSLYQQGAGSSYL